MKKWILFLYALLCSLIFQSYTVLAADYFDQADQLIEYAQENGYSLDNFAVLYNPSGNLLQMIIIENDDFVKFEYTASNQFYAYADSNIVYSVLTYNFDNSSIEVSYKHTSWPLKNIGFGFNKTTSTVYYASQNILNSDGSIYFQKNYPYVKKRYQTPDIISKFDDYFSSIGNTNMLSSNYANVRFFYQVQENNYYYTIVYSNLINEFVYFGTGIDVDYRLMVGDQWAVIRFGEGFDLNEIPSQHGPKFENNDRSSYLWDYELHNSQGFSHVYGNVGTNTFEMLYANKKLEFQQGTGTTIIGVTVYDPDWQPIYVDFPITGTEGGGGEDPDPTPTPTPPTIQDDIMDSSPPDLGGLEDSAGWLPAGPVDSIINLPLTLFQNLFDSLSTTCEPVELPLPFVDEKLELPCLNSIYSQVDGLSIWINSIGLVAAAFILYKYLLSLYAWVDKTLTFRENTWSDWGGV